MQSLLALLVLLALGWPLHRLLSREEGAQEVSATATASVASGKDADSAAAAQSKVLLQVDFTSAPTKLTINSLGQPIWEQSSPALSVERELTLSYPAEGIDLELEFAWPEGQRAAARVRLTPPSGEPQERSIFGTGPTSEVLTFR